ASGDELFVVQLRSTYEREAIGASTGDVTGSILVIQRVIEEMSAFADGRGSRDECHFAETLRAFVGFDQFLQSGFSALRTDLCDSSVFKVDLEILDESAAIAEREGGRDDPVGA